VLWRAFYTGAGQSLDAIFAGEEGASSMTPPQLRIYEIDSQVLFLKEPA
jgi:hypothetical protein